MGIDPLTINEKSFFSFLDLFSLTLLIGNFSLFDFQCRISLVYPVSIEVVRGNAACTQHGVGVCGDSLTNDASCAYPRPLLNVDAFDYEVEIAFPIIVVPAEEECSL